jgi:hypothetical protein
MTVDSDSGDSGDNWPGSGDSGDRGDKWRVFVLSDADKAQKILKNRAEFFGTF